MTDIGPQAPGATPIDGAVSAHPEIPIAGADIGPANPSRSEVSGWYDAPKNTEELVAGRVADEAPAQSRQPGEQGAAQEGEKTGEQGRSLLGEHHDTAYNFQDYTPPSLPEGSKLEHGPVKDLREVLTAQLGHQERHNKLLDLHAKEISRVAKALADNQVKVWSDTNDRWKSEAREQFGDKLETELGYGKGFLEEAVGGDKARLQRILQFLDYTGAGNNPDMIWLFAQAGKMRGVFENQMIAGQPSARGAPGGAAGSRGWYNRT